LHLDLFDQPAERSRERREPQDSGSGIKIIDEQAFNINTGLRRYTAGFGYSDFLIPRPESGIPNPSFLR
jgi:hypothetical protein